MDTASTEEKFHHAVELIRNLPKSGSYHPSNELKLKFYSYFKQATEGPCDAPKPGFWDVVSRAKWEAWNNLGEMSKEEAMKRYVDEFVQILTSAPFDERAKDYVHLMGPFFYLAPKEFREQHLKPNGNVPNSTNNIENALGQPEDVVQNNHVNVRQLKGRNPELANDSSEESHRLNGLNQNGTTESDSEEFSDTYDQVNGEESENDRVVSAATHQDTSDTALDNSYCSPDSEGPSVIVTRGGADQRVVPRSAESPIPSGSGNRGNRSHRRTRGDLPASHRPSNHSGGGGSGGRRNDENRVHEPPTDVSEQLAFAVIRLQHTMDQVVSRLDSLEALLQEKNNSSCVSTVKSSFSSILGIPPRAALLIFIWPFIAQWLMYQIQKRRRRGL